MKELWTVDPDKNLYPVKILMGQSVRQWIIKNLTPNSQLHCQKWNILSFDLEAFILNKKKTRTLLTVMDEEVSFAMRKRLKILR